MSTFVRLLYRVIFVLFSEGKDPKEAEGVPHSTMGGITSCDSGYHILF